MASAPYYWASAPLVGQGGHVTGPKVCIAGPQEELLRPGGQRSETGTKRGGEMQENWRPGSGHVWRGVGDLEESLTSGVSRPVPVVGTSGESVKCFYCFKVSTVCVVFSKATGKCVNPSVEYGELTRC